MLIIGRAKNGNLVGVQLTSNMGRSGTKLEWGSGEKSVVRPERLIQVDLSNYRKEGAYVKKPLFESVVATVMRHHGQSGPVELYARVASGL